MPERTRKLIYLACPLADSDPAVREHRFRTANKVAGILMAKGHDVFSPLSHSVPIYEEHALSEERWHGLGLRMLERCDELWVLTLDGWLESRGVSLETAAAWRDRKPVRFVDENGELLEETQQTKRRDK